jgi:hypothetical protein
MRSVRFSIMGLMGVVLVAAIGLAALRNASETWAGFLLLATLGAFCVALVGAFCRGGAQRGAWIGFAVFGWIYMGAAFEPYDLAPKLPTHSLLEVLAPKFGADSGPFQKTDESRRLGGGGFGRMFGADRANPFFQIGHCLSALVAATLGALLGGWLFGLADKRTETISAGCDAAATGEGRPSKCRVALLIYVLSSLALLATITIAGAILPDKIWAASTFLLTWWQIGLVALAGLFGRGKLQAARLGAAFFGACFMILAFGQITSDPWPQFPIPTVELLDEIRPWLPAVSNGLRADPESTTALNARIHEALKQRVPMRFDEETPLEDVFKSIRKATAGADGKGIPIYVDPIGLSEADKSIRSTVRYVGFDGVPLRTSLRAFLRQCDLAYRVQDGLVVITSEKSNDTSLRSAAPDSFQVVGHCVLALVAAGLGGLVAPIVSNAARKPDGSTRRTSAA